MRFCTAFIGLAIAAWIASGCSSLGTSHRIVVAGELTSDLEITLIPFHPPYLDQRILVRVSSPPAMQGEVISLSIMNGWGRDAVHYSTEKIWERRSGHIEFEVDARDIQVRPNEPRRINVNLIDVKKWPNQTPLPTPASVTPAANAPVAPPPGVAGL